MWIIQITLIPVLIKNSSYPKPNKSLLKVFPGKTHWLSDLKSRSTWNVAAWFHSSACRSRSLDSALCLGQRMPRELLQGNPAPSTPELLQHSNYGPCSGFRRDLVSKFRLIYIAGVSQTVKKMEKLEIWLVQERGRLGCELLTKSIWKKLYHWQSHTQQKIREAGCTAPTAFSLFWTKVIYFPTCTRTQVLTAWRQLQGVGISYSHIESDFSPE